MTRPQTWRNIALALAFAAFLLLVDPVTRGLAAVAAGEIAVGGGV